MEGGDTVNHLLSAGAAFQTDEDRKAREVKTTNARAAGVFGQPLYFVGEHPLIPAEIETSTRPASVASRADGAESQAAQSQQLSLHGKHENSEGSCGTQALPSHPLAVPSTAVAMNGIADATEKLGFKEERRFHESHKESESDQDGSGKVGGNSTGQTEAHPTSDHSDSDPLVKAYLDRARTIEFRGLRFSGGIVNPQTPTLSAVAALAEARIACRDAAAEERESQQTLAQLAAGVQERKLAIREARRARKARFSCHCAPVLLNYALWVVGGVVGLHWMQLLCCSGCKTGGVAPPTATKYWHSGLTRLEKRTSLVRLAAAVRKKGCCWNLGWPTKVALWHLLLYLLCWSLVVGGRAVTIQASVGANCAPWLPADMFNSDADISRNGDGEVGVLHAREGSRGNLNISEVMLINVTQDALRTDWLWTVEVLARDLTHILAFQCLKQSRLGGTGAHKATNWAPTNNETSDGLGINGNYTDAAAQSGMANAGEGGSVPVVCYAASVLGLLGVILHWLSDPIWMATITWHAGRRRHARPTPMMASEGAQLNGSDVVKTSASAAKHWSAVGVWEVSRPGCGCTCCCHCSAVRWSLAVPLVSSWCTFLAFLYAWTVQNLRW
eukprot:SAG31_NODE_2562_length_5475_cov_2.364769_4_plen_614_part_00